MYHHAEVAHCRKKSMTIHFFSIDMSGIPISFIPVRVRRQLRGVRRAVNLKTPWLPPFRFGFEAGAGAEAGG